MVTVTRIDRLARSTFDLFAIVKQIVDAKAQFRPLAEPWADTGTSTGRLMIAVLGGLADVERDLIRTRTAEGRSRAKAQGQQMGRPPSLTPEQQKEATRRRAQGATLQELAPQLRPQHIHHAPCHPRRMSEDCHSRSTTTLTVTEWNSYFRVAGMALTDITVAGALQATGGDRNCHTA